MVIKKSQTTPESFAKGKILDYPLGDEPVGISYQEHHGRVPEVGWGVNTVCWEAYYITAGKAVVFIDNENFEVETGDVIILKPNQKSYLVGNRVKFITITKPDWYSKQYKEYT